MFGNTVSHGEAQLESSLDDLIRRSWLQMRMHTDMVVCAKRNSLSRVLFFRAAHCHNAIANLVLSTVMDLGVAS